MVWPVGCKYWYGDSLLGMDISFSNRRQGGADVDGALKNPGAAEK
jgi:hypothetical protein